MGQDHPRDHPNMPNRTPPPRSGLAQATTIAMGIILALALVGIGVYGIYVARQGAVECRDGYRATIGMRGIFCAQGYVP